MSSDLLLQLLDAMIERQRPPDILSRGWDVQDRPVIRFAWETGQKREVRARDFPYTATRYAAVWKRFNDYWWTRTNHE